MVVGDQLILPVWDHILFFFVNTRSCFGSKVFSYVESKSWLEVETQRGKPSWQMNAAMLC
ncbi:hypothetical protein V6Z12_D05G081700 [Gossypium hirsutum]|uniref:Uncharacterized protein n=1 Tax=Gossypium tomentosum TaxID=34277 RepID=A0A5D2KS57_GOSTO|nr:hypothetical protein ES332_D05G083600v1 [Gossypium tomentosum]